MGSAVGEVGGKFWVVPRNRVARSADGPIGGAPRCSLPAANIDWLNVAEPIYSISNEIN